MKWQKGIEVTSGSTWSTSTDLGEVAVSYKKQPFQGVIEYRYTPVEQADEDLHEETIMLETTAESLIFDFLPLYPDRPVVFSVDEDLKIPPGQNGFFCLTVRIAYGLSLRRTDTTIQQLLPHDRKKSYWGPPNNGVMTYRETSSPYGEAADVLTKTDTATAIVPVYYFNRRESDDLVEHCLVPLQELDLYRNEQDDLVFEVIRLVEEEEYYQEPTPQKRAPREVEASVKHFHRAPAEAQSLFEQVKSLPKLTEISSLFLNR